MYLPVSQEPDLDMKGLEKSLKLVGATFTLILDFDIKYYGLFTSKISKINICYGDLKMLIELC